MNINLKKELKSLKGEVLKDNEGEIVTLGYALSNILSNSRASGKMKLFILAQKCFSDKNMELDASDLALIKKVVVESEIYSVLVLGQIENILENTTEKK